VINYVESIIINVRMQDSFLQFIIFHYI